MTAEQEQSKTIVIGRALYNSLLEDRAFLRQLHAAGVDNWEGYSEAQNGSDEEESYEDIYGEENKQE